MYQRRPTSLQADRLAACL